MLVIHGKTILTLIAAQAEYGTAMQQLDINPEFIGVGPIEAAFNTTQILFEKQKSATLPDFIFSIGTAGSSKLNQAELYQISSVSYRDMDASAFGFPKGTTPFTDYPAQFNLPTLLPDMPTASLATGASVINQQGTSGQKFSDIDADCVDMESYAIARVAHHFNIPLIGLRGISDGKENSNGIASWEEYMHVIDQKIADYYNRLIEKPEALKSL